MFEGIHPVTVSPKFPQQVLKRLERMREIRDGSTNTDPHPLMKVVICGIK